MPAARPGDIISRGPGFCHAVGYGHGHPGALQDSQIDDVIAHIADFIPSEAGLCEETFHSKDFTALFLPKEIYFQFPDPPCRGGRWAAGNPAHFEALAPQVHQAEAALDIELLQFLRPSDEHGGVGQNAVHITEQQPDALEGRVKGCRMEAAGRAAAARLSALCPQLLILGIRTRHFIEQRNEPLAGLSVMRSFRPGGSCSAHRSTPVPAWGESQ